MSLQNLVKKIKERHPSWEINFSTLTNTGYRIAKEKLRSVDAVFFVPLDFALVVRKFFRALRPHLLILAESEFWPNLLRAAKRQTQGIILINGRISSHSFRQYARFRRLALKVLQNIDLFLVQTEQDAERLARIGIDPKKLRRSGNLKCDIDLPLMTDEAIADLKKSLGIPESKRVITAGSTRKGEEEALIKAFREARKSKEDSIFILAPRHLERCPEVEKVCQDAGFEVRRRTAARADGLFDVLLLDTMGELAHFYALADVAFIGGSLVPWGGQNLLEPSFYSKPVFFGPHMDNFAFLAEEYIRKQAAKMVEKKEDLVSMFLMENEEQLREMGKRAKQLLMSLQGATETALEAIEAMMSGGKTA